MEYQVINPEIIKKPLDNIRFVSMENNEVSSKIQEIKLFKTNESQYIIFRLKTGGRVVVKGEGEFLIAGERYKIYRKDKELEIENSSGEKFDIGGEK